MNFRTIWQVPLLSPPKSSIGPHSLWTSFEFRAVGASLRTLWRLSLRRRCGFFFRRYAGRRVWAGDCDQKQRPTAEDGQTAQDHQTLLIRKQENKAGNRGKDRETRTHCWPAPFRLLRTQRTGLCSSASLWKSWLWLGPNEGTFKRATVVTFLCLARECHQSLDFANTGHPARPCFDAKPEPGWRPIWQLALC